jgi:hypothetical protein
MPFKETRPVEERIALFRDYETGVLTVSELCRRHGISRRRSTYGTHRRRSGSFWHNILRSPYISH